MRTMPPDFRRLITDALEVVADHFADPDISRCACLALAICHIERFSVDHSLRQATEWVTKAAQCGDVMAQCLFARIYDAADIPIPQNLLWKAWLVNAMNHGSFTAKRTLQQTDEGEHDEAMKAHLEEQHRRNLAHRHILETYITQNITSVHQFLASNAAHQLPTNLFEIDILYSPGTSPSSCYLRLLSYSFQKLLSFIAHHTLAMWTFVAPSLT